MTNGVKTRFAKKAVRISTSVATAATIRGIMRNNIEPSDNAVINLVQDASILVTSFVVIAMTREAIGKYTDAKIDAFVATIEKERLQTQTR